MRGLRKTDSLYVLLTITVAFLLLLAPIYPLVSQFDAWPAIFREYLVAMILGVLAHAGGYWIACKRMLQFRLRH
jgi:hypothetical protein